MDIPALNMPPQNADADSPTSEGLIDVFPESPSESAQPDTAPARRSLNVVQN
jgi:hypothetical protein